MRLCTFSPAYPLSAKTRCNKWEDAARVAYQRSAAVTILDVAGGSASRKGTPIRVNECMALDALDSLAGVVVRADPLASV